MHASSTLLYLRSSALILQVLDEADTMFDRGFGPEIKKFLAPLRNRSLKAENSGFQTVLVTATITQVIY